MKHVATAIALVGEESGKPSWFADTQALQGFDQFSHHHRLDLQRDLARLPGFDDFGFSLEAAIQGREPGGGVAKLSEAFDLRREMKLVHTTERCTALTPEGAQASWGCLRASSRSTAFIMTEGVVMALS